MMRTRTVLFAILFFAALATSGVLLGGCAAEFDDLGSIHIDTPKGVRFGFGKPAEKLAENVQHYDPRNKRIADWTMGDMLEQRRKQIAYDKLRALRPQ